MLAKSKVTIIRAFPVEQRLVPSVPPFPLSRKSSQVPHAKLRPSTHTKVFSHLSPDREKNQLTRGEQLRVGTVFCIFPFFQTIQNTRALFEKRKRKESGDAVAFEAKRFRLERA